MYSCDQDHTTAAAAARAPFANTSYHQLAPTRRQAQPGQQAAVLPAAAAAATVHQPRRTRSKKHGAPRPLSSSSSSRRSSTTVVATDVNNFRAMVQELTGFPPAAIFRPLPRRVHAAGPFVGGHGHGGLEATNSSTATGGSSGPNASAALPAVMAPPAQFAAVGMFDGLAELGSPEFDCWGDLSIE